MNHTSIYSVFSRCLLNLNTKFTPIFLKITLIPHLLMFCRIKRKIKQGKDKKLRRKNPVVQSTGSPRRGGSPRQRKERSPRKKKEKPRVRLSEDTLLQGSLRRSKIIHIEDTCPSPRTLGWNNKPCIFSPFLAHFPNSINICI